MTTRRVQGTYFARHIAQTLQPWEPLRRVSWRAFSEADAQDVADELSASHPGKVMILRRTGSLLRCWYVPTSGTVAARRILSADTFISPSVDADWMSTWYACRNPMCMIGAIQRWDPAASRLIVRTLAEKIVGLNVTSDMMAWLQTPLGTDVSDRDQGAWAAADADQKTVYGLVKIEATLLGRRDNRYACRAARRKVADTLRSLMPLDELAEIVSENDPL